MMEWKEDDEGYIWLNNNCAGKIENENVEIMFTSSIFSLYDTFIPMESISLKLLKKSTYLKKILTLNEWYRPIIRSNLRDFWHHIYDRHIITATHVTYRISLLFRKKKRERFMIYIEKLRTNDPLAELYFDFLLIDTYMKHYFCGRYQFLGTDYISYVINLGERLSKYAPSRPTNPNSENVRKELRLQAFNIRHFDLVSICTRSICLNTRARDEDLKGLIPDSLIRKMGEYKSVLEIYTEKTFIENFKKRKLK